MESTQAHSSRAARYALDRDTSRPPSSISKWVIVVLIIIVLGLLATVIALAITLAAKSASADAATSAPITSPSTTSTSTVSSSSQSTFTLRCTPDTLSSRAAQHVTTGVKLPVAPERLGNHLLIKNTYVAEFPSDLDVKRHFRSVTNTLRAAKQIDTSEVHIRSIFRSSLFNGASFSLTSNESIEAAKILESAIDIQPVYSIPAPRVIRSSFASAKALETNQYVINAMDLTNVAQVHERFNNFGQGVRIAVIDSGVDYTHPALGGCFGRGCKVEFGYDLSGDKYSTNDPTLLPDGDPMDNCSAVSHGTHVAGIIAANITGINQEMFIPSVPFIGVAPNVILGAYRVFGCPADNTDTAVVAEAIYRAYDDKADIITISIGGPSAYTVSAVAIAAQRVSDMGVYVTMAVGNDGDGGLQTSGAMSDVPGVMNIGSADNSFTLKNVFIAPGGSKIFYENGALFGQWTRTFNSTIVVHNPNGGPDDGCLGLSTSVNRTVVLFAYTESDQCSSTFRCEAAADAGALACLLYNIDSIAGGQNIPSGAISLADGQRIVATVAADPSAIYTFANTLGLAAVNTAGTLSSFSSMGPTADLLTQPQLTGIGGMVYSTVSVSSAEQNKLPKPYVIMSGTSMATPYVAGVLALFLASIGNPPPHTVSGYADDGKCRPKASLAKNIFQSTAKPVRIYNSALFATTVHQGAGLVNALQALTTTAMFSPSELALNDTVRRASSYKVNITNIGNRTAVYRLTHSGAALATGASSEDALLLTRPLYSADYAEISIEPDQFQLAAGASREITLRFSDPFNADASLLPVYSGFIYATNQVNGETTHLSYAGVKGDYGNAPIFMRNNATDVRTGVRNALGTFASDGGVLRINATEGVIIQGVLAWSTRLLMVEVLPASQNAPNQSNSSLGVAFSNALNAPLYVNDLVRNVPSWARTNFPGAYPLTWNGYLARPDGNGSYLNPQISRLPASNYRLKFSALKHFGNVTNSNDYDVYYSPVFGIYF